MDDRQGRIDPEFAALPLRELADAALAQARALGAQHADFRAERVRGQYIALSDGNLQGAADADDTGLAVRVVVDGTWGFASAVDLDADAAAQAARQAVEVAKVSAAMNTEPIELAPEPAHGDVTWVSAYEIDPFTVAMADKVALLAGWSNALLAHPAVSHVDAVLQQVMECKFYTDGATTATQQRIRLYPALTAIAVTDDGRFDDMRTLAPPVGRGYEYLTSGASGGWDFAAELAELPDLLAAKLRAPSVEPGRYDLVMDPSNLWLTIHESIGHATELDRALGYEAAYAGTSFATPDKLGTLRYGSEVMHVTGDRTAEHGLATVGYDDEGVAGQSWDLISGGILVGYQLDRRMAQRCGFGRSNGCAFSDSPGHVPLQRMANVSLQPARPAARPPRISSPGWRTESTSSETRAGRSTCSGTTSSSPASGSSRSSTGGWPGSCAMSPTRPPPPTSGAPWRPSAGRRPTCSAAPSTAARASPARSPRLATAARPR